MKIYYLLICILENYLKYFKLIKSMNENLISEITNELKKYKDVEAIYLFGSYAKNTQKPISDIDICVITKKKISSKIRSEILSSGSKKIDISIFWDLPIIVKSKVFKEGKLLYSKNDEFITETLVKTMKEFIDFKPKLDRFVKLYLT